MSSEVKKCADAGDIIGLRYIFVDSLDVDPTFEEYKEDYAYCKNLSGLFEDYIELTPLLMDAVAWNEDYWVKLKVDLLKNFSQRRFEHMMEVAKIVHAEKVVRLLKERESAAAKTKEVKHTKTESLSAKPITKVNLAEQKKVFEYEKKQMELEYQKAKEREEKEKAELLKKKKELEQQKALNQTDSSKKWMGTAVVLILIVALLVLIMKWL